MTTWDEDYPRSLDAFQGIAAILLAGDIQSRVVSNAEACAVEVSLIDGSKVLWGNTGETWAFTMILPDGMVEVYTVDDVPWSLSVEEAARLIALHPYPVTTEFPSDTPRV